MLQILRILKTYDLLKESQMELFGVHRRNKSKKNDFFMD